MSLQCWFLKSLKQKKLAEIIDGKNMQEITAYINENRNTINVEKTLLDIIEFQQENYIKLDYGANVMFSALVHYIITGSDVFLSNILNNSGYSEIIKLYSNFDDYYKKYSLRSPNMSIDEYNQRYKEIAQHFETDLQQIEENKKIDDGLNFIEQFVKNNFSNNGWISVEEQLPTKDGDYLVYYVYEDMKPFCSVSEFSAYLNMFDGDHVYITHWQPLPQLPLENENAK